MYSFKENLKELRKEHELTQKQLATKINLIEQTYQGYEQGRTEPSIATLIRLADIFECSIDYLVGRATVLDVVNITSDLSAQQKELLQNFDKLNTEGKARLLGYLLALLSMPLYVRK